MNKKLLAVAVVGALASPIAFAQTTTIYGNVDVGFQHESGYASGSSNKNFIESGQDSTSKIGFKGSDDLAPGLTALYVLEAGINVDNGTQDTVGFWQRQAYGGLDSKQWGALTLGRQYTVMHNNYGVGTWSVLTAAGNLGISGHQVRQSNLVKYTSPKFGGFTIAGSWSPGGTDPSSTGTTAASFNASGEPTTTNPDNGRLWELGGLWAQGPFGASLTHSTKKVQAAPDESQAKRDQIAGKFDNGTFGVYAGWARDKVDSSGAIAEAKVKHYWIQPVMRFGGNNEAWLSWGKVKDDVTADNNTTFWGIGGRHYMTKRTWLYAAYGKMNNDGSANRRQSTVAVAPAAGQDPSAFQIGVNTSF